jgi:riboflavin kinase/FMN adenylyltransferase
MQLHHSLASIASDHPIALTIGAFDGIHRGHQHLIGLTCAAARRIGGRSVVMTFEPHPDTVLYPDRPRLVLTDNPTRTALIEATGVDHLVILPFDRNLAQLTAHAFMEQVCDAMTLRELWIGPDFRLGKGGKGTGEVLTQIGAELGYVVHQVERYVLHGHEVTSTLIRQLLEDGNVTEVAHLLGRPFTVQGEVVHGDHRGRTIGFPTANLATAPTQLLPANGVYACHVLLPDDVAPRLAVTNIGVRPTFGTLERRTEVHILDYEGDVYGETLRLAFLDRLRGEQRFAGIDALIAQIGADVQQARELLGTER